jgi:two-component system chemotaxis response regulator CheB
MANRDIVVVGASAGGVEALSRLVGHLPSDLEAALFIASHSAPYSPSLLPAILSRAGPLPATHAVHGEAIRRGRVYVAPPDHHMLLEDHGVRLTRGPKENRFRPAVDPLFRSAAYSYGPRVVGVVLTGALDDGTAGLWAIKDRGGKAIVQDPAEARHPSMPLSALQHVEVDHKLPVAEIAGMLVRLSSEPAADEAAYPISDQLEIETRIANEGQALRAGALKLGNFSPFTCPECHGSLMQIKDGSLIRYRCHTGHAYSVDSLLATLAETSEDALWNALRSVEESVILLAHLGEHAQEANKTALAASFKARAKEAQKRVDAIRRIITAGGSSQPVLEEISQTRKRA